MGTQPQPYGNMTAAESTKSKRALTVQIPKLDNNSISPLNQLLQQQQQLMDKQQLHQSLQQHSKNIEHNLSENAPVPKKTPVSLSATGALPSPSQVFGFRNTTPHRAPWYNNNNNGNSNSNNGSNGSGSSGSSGSNNGGGGMGGGSINGTPTPTMGMHHGNAIN